MGLRTLIDLEVVEALNLVLQIHMASGRRMELRFRRLVDDLLLGPYSVMSTVQCFEGKPKFGCAQCSTTIVRPHLSSPFYSDF
jgi:hypothetical protein